MNVRCPFCDEALRISEQEVDLPIECPRCHKTFIWAQEIKAHRDKKEARKEHLREIRLQKEAKLRELEEERRRRAEQKRMEATRIKYHCAVCDKGFGDVDFPSHARREGGKVYCCEHIPKTRPCPDCGKEVSKKAPMCPHCGREFVRNVDLVPAGKNYPRKYEHPAHGHPARREDPRLRLGATHKTTSATGFKLGFFGCLGIAAAGILILVVLAAIGGIFSSHKPPEYKNPVIPVKQDSRVEADYQREQEARRRRLEQERERLEEERRQREWREEQRWRNPVTVSARELYSDYEENEVAADKRWGGEVLEVRGVVGSIGKDILGKAYVVLAGDDDNWYRGDYIGFGVHCTFSSSREDDIVGMAKGRSVCITGECTGRTLGSVMLRNCRSK